MAHPYQSHREHSKSRGRSAQVLKSGGDAHPDAAQDKKLIAKALREHEKMEHDVPGYARGGRIAKYARGGKADKKHHTQVNIAVVSPHRGDGSGAGAAPPGGGAPPPIPPRPPMAGPPGLPPGLPPGVGGPPGMLPPGAMPPPGPMPGRPMMKRGGAVKRAYGGQVSHADGHGSGIGRGRVKPGGGVHAKGPFKAKFASGGPTKPVSMPSGIHGGGYSGVGRIQKAHRYGGSKKNKPTI